MTPPTWRYLAARARKLKLWLLRGNHEASLFSAGPIEITRFRSWIGKRADDLILRTAVAAALEQLEAGR